MPDTTPIATREIPPPPLSQRGAGGIFSPLNQEAGFQGRDVPAEADMYRCVHCGLCLSACPTYMVTGLETESPRGRIALMKAVNEGRLGISQRVVSHWEMCLQCRACEAVCPSGVPYGRIMENTRSQVLAQGKQSDSLKRVSRLFLRAVLPYPGRLRLGAHLVRAYQRSGLQKLVRMSGVLRVLPGPLAELEAQLPVMGGHFFGPTRRVYRAQGVGAGFKPALTVGLLSGCVMPLMQGSTMRAAVRVLTRNGCDVVVPVGQGCCGALNLHSGDLEFGRRMARRNIDVFLAAGVDRIVVASAGCSAAMKEYSDLLKDDPRYAEKARRFSQVTVDITELLVDLPFDPPKAPSGKESPFVPPLLKGGVGGFGLAQRVTYQDPCHLAHAQRITAAPRTILKSIPGLELVEMENAAMCCGGAGIYWMVQQELSHKILDRKLEAIAATGAETVVTANPGCVLQIERGLSRRGIPGKVCHVVDLLDRAYQAEESKAVQRALRACVRNHFRLV